MSTVVSRQGVLGGTPCFRGTRVPVKILFDYLRDGASVQYFLEQYPGVTKEQVLEILDQSESDILASAEPIDEAR